MIELAGDSTPATESCTDTMVVIRNMNSRTKSDPCTCVHCTFGRNMLRAKQNLAGDLASHMFGHLVSTEVARDILTTFIVDGVIEVFKGVVDDDERAHEGPFDPHSEDVQHALGQAFKAATVHDCIRLRQGENVPGRHAPVDQGEKEENTYIFRWRVYPQELSNPDECVSFFNDITDRAFAASKTYFATKKLELQHRFATSKDERHFVSLTYDSDRDIRPPDFLLLPIQAFSGANFGVVDKRYLSFGAARLVGETSEHLGDAVDCMERHLEGLRCAQPWVYYVLGMAISLSEDAILFSRVDLSDWEHLALLLWDGRGCIEFIRVLLGLALADGLGLGQNPAIQLMCATRTFQIKDRRPPSTEASSEADSLPDDGSPDEGMSTPSSHSAPDMSYQSTVEKRHHNEIEEEEDTDEDSRLKKHKIVEDT